LRKSRITKLRNTATREEALNDENSAMGNTSHSPVKNTVM